MTSHILDPFRRLVRWFFQMPKPIFMLDLDGHDRMSEVAIDAMREQSQFLSFMDRVTAICYQISYKPGWSIVIGRDGPRAFIQISVSAESDATLDSVKRDGTRTPWKSGKRYLSPHMCRQEIVGTVFALIKDAEMHEVHEWFRYKDRSIYNPHLDPDVLAEIAGRKESFCVRQNAMTMEELK